MSLTSKDIAIGSGSLYIASYNPTSGIPTDATLEVEANRLGHIKEGATIKYNPTFYTAKDDLGKVSKTIITEEDVVLNCGVITWNASTLDKLCSTGTLAIDNSGKEVLTIGGLENFVEKKYVLRFVHQDGKHRVTLVGSNQAGFELGYKKDAETSIGAEFHAVPMEHTGAEGRLLIYEDSSNVTPPEPDPDPEG